MLYEWKKGFSFVFYYHSPPFNKGKVRGFTMALENPPRSPFFKGGSCCDSFCLYLLSVCYPNKNGFQARIKKLMNLILLLFPEIFAFKGTDGIGDRPDEFGMAHDFGHIPLEFEGSFHDPLDEILFALHNGFKISV